MISLDLDGTRKLGDGEGYLNASLFTSFQQLELLDLSSNHIVGCIRNEGVSLIKFSSGQISTFFLFSLICFVFDLLWSREAIKFEQLQVS